MYKNVNTTQPYFGAYYNMVDVAVAMVISTVHEKSCIDSHNARKFENKIQNWVIHRYRNHNDEIVEILVMNYLSYHSYTTQLFRRLFLTKLNQNSYLNYHWFHKKKLSTHASCTDWSTWPLRSQNAPYIMLKSLNKDFVFTMSCVRYSLSSHAKIWELPVYDRVARHTCPGV